MKTHKDIRPEMAISKDKNRVALRESYLDITDGKGSIVVTDGKILAVIPVAVTPEDSAGYISTEVLRRARKVGRSDEMEVALNGNATFPDGGTMPRSVEGKDCQYPNWRAVIPTYSKEDTILEIGIDALRLWQLAQAMGTQGVKLRIKSSDVSIMVEPIGCGKYSDGAPVVCPDARGVIMPITLATEPDPVG